ncbi:hypothetical protein NCCP28_27000 [Niallia sp. NCCP-28]|nr:hypothetical protein NCCP28_27000 [Niallia sp. NCCP-28]
MEMILGILCLIFLCSSILILSSLPIALYQKKQYTKHKLLKKHKDYYLYLFDVYSDHNDK